jgi:cell division protein FtsZ
MSERSLFDHEAADVQADDIFDHDFDDLDADGIPVPAYRPVAEHVAIDRAEDFVAPAPRPAGTPSPETLERLRAAVGHASGNPPRAKMQAQPMNATQTRPHADDKPRFGIGNLLGRMSGHHPEAAPAPRQQPQVSTTRDAPDADPDQERIEIPAFLRRQAN